MQENVKTVTVRSTGIRYGLILGVLGIIMFILFIIFSVDMSSNVRWLGYPLYIVIVVLAHMYYKTNGDGFMTYPQGVGIAFWAGLISSGISSVFTYMYVKFVDDGMIQMIRQAQIEQFEAQGKTDAEIDQMMKFVSMFSSPEAIFVFGIVGGIVSMVIIGVIVSIFTQKSNPQPTF